MPYIPRSVPQALDIIDPGVIDVYSSPDVYVNYVKVALWNPPQSGGPLNALNLPPDNPPVSYAPSQAQLDNLAASVSASTSNPETFYYSGGGGTTGSMVGGDAPATGTEDPNDLVGNPPAGSPAFDLPPGSSIWASLEANLNNCLGGSNKSAKFQENGNNPLIIDLWHQLGFTDQEINRLACGIGKCNQLDQPPWCAVFAGAVLKNSGAEYLKKNAAGPAFAKAWKCKPIPVNDPTQWRRNDLVVKTSGKYSHVCFVRAVDLQNRTFQAVGGNTGDTVAQIDYPGALGTIFFVGRAWEVPAEVDKPIIMNITPGKTVAPKVS